MGLWCSLESYEEPLFEGLVADLEAIIDCRGGLKNWFAYHEYARTSLLSEPKLHELDRRFYQAAGTFSGFQGDYVNGWNDVYLRITSEILDYVWHNTLWELNERAYSVDYGEDDFEKHQELLRDYFGFGNLIRHELPALMEARRHLDQGRFVYYSPNK